LGRLDLDADGDDGFGGLLRHASSLLAGRAAFARGRGRPSRL
jgi:hypothetical protein